MPLIYKTKNFLVEAFEKPHVSREEGGHIKICPKKTISDRTEMSQEMAVEFIRLTMVVGKAMKKAMTNRGIKIMRVNYQDMGNWAFKKGEKPTFHMHIYGRAKNSMNQPYKEAVQLPDRATGFYNRFKPLNTDDIAEIKKQIESILKEKKYLEWK